MAIICYVEMLNADKSFGVTANHAMMMENANKLRVKGIEPPFHDISAFVFQAGRYLAVVAMDANNKLGMIFLDCKNYEGIAKDAGSRFEEPLRRIFMKNFYELSKNYKKNYNLVSLEIGKGFPPNMSAN